MSLPEVDLGEALTDPCPVCGMKATKGVGVAAYHPEPTDGSVLICFGCTLVQIVSDGKRVAVPEEMSDWLFGHPELQHQILIVAKIRASNPHRV